jgi:hypothetical protein
LAPEQFGNRGEGEIGISGSIRLSRGVVVVSRGVVVVGMLATESATRGGGDGRLIILLRTQNE